MDAGDIRWRLVFAEERKQGLSFHAGLFLDELAATRRGCFQFPRSRRVAVLKESPLNPVYSTVDRLRRRYNLVLTFLESLLRLGPPFECLYFGTSWIDGGQPRTTSSKAKRVSFIANIQHDPSAGYALRGEIAQRLINEPAVDCFGRGIREIPSKTDALDDYMFSIAMENVSQDFYFTEKLIDCFMTETVPVYWGSPGIEAIFDPRGMIRFATAEELLRLLPTLNAELYRKMKPFVLENQRRTIAQRLASYQGFYSRVMERAEARLHLSQLGPCPAPSRWATGIRWAASAVGCRC